MPSLSTAPRKRVPLSDGAVSKRARATLELVFDPEPARVDARCAARVASYSSVRGFRRLVAARAASAPPALRRAAPLAGGDDPADGALARRVVEMRRRLHAARERAARPPPAFAADPIYDEQARGRGVDAFLQQWPHEAARFEGGVALATDHVGGAGCDDAIHGTMAEDRRGARLTQTAVHAVVRAERDAVRTDKTRRALPEVEDRIGRLVEPYGLPASDPADRAARRDEHYEGFEFAPFEDPEPE